MSQKMESKEGSAAVVLSPEGSGLLEILERTMDKGVVIDAKVRVELCRVNLLGVEATVMLSSFKIAEKIGLAFPKDVDTNTQAWQALRSKDSCPVCGMESEARDLEEEGCPWCGWNCRLEVG